MFRRRKCVEAKSSVAKYNRILSLEVLGKTLSERRCYIALWAGGTKDFVLYSQELEAYLGAGLLIADRVRSVIRRQFAQLDHNVPKFGAGTDISFRTNT